MAIAGVLCNGVEIGRNCDGYGVMYAARATGWREDSGPDLFACRYQMGYGKLLFQSGSMASLLPHSTANPMPTLLSSRPDVPPCMMAISNKAWAKKGERSQIGVGLAEATQTGCQSAFTENVQR